MPNSSSQHGQLQRAGIQRLISDKKGKKRKKLVASKIRESFGGKIFTEKGQDETGKSANGKQQKSRVYLVTIIEEGLGNSKDRNYYSSDALKSGTNVFNGAKAYADHPDAITEKTLPERSMKDLVGWYSDCFVDKNPQTGKARLRGKLHFFPSAKWLTDMIDTILTDKSAKNLFGISINAVGRTRPAQMNGEEVNYVEEFQRVDSADVVTEPAARGKFDQMLESRRSVAGGHSRKVSNSMGTRSKRTRESAVLSPEKAKEVADALVSAYNSDNPDEMKEASFSAAKQLYAVSSISGKGPGQPNEEQYSNINPSGGKESMAKSKKMKASIGRRSFRKGKRLVAADGKGADNENVDEPDPDDIEPRLEESDVEDEEGDKDVGALDDFGGSKHYAKEARGRGGRRMAAQEGFEDEGFEDEGAEDEGFEDEDEGFEDEDGGMPGAMPPGAGMGAAPGGGAPGSSRTVASAEADDDDDDGDDDLDDMDEAFEDEDEGFEDEGMEDEGGQMRPGTVAEAGRRRMAVRASGRSPRRRFSREAGRASGQGQTVSKASFAGGLGHSGNTALPKGGDPTKGYDPGGTDEDWGKKDDSTSAVGKSYKIKTSKFRRNKVARRVAQEANRRIEILEHNVMRLRESLKATGRTLNRYKGIVRFTESQKSAHRLLNRAVEEGFLPEEMVNESRVLRESLYGLSERDQIREIKKTALLLESAQEGVVSRLSESVDGSGARGGAVSYIRTAGAEDSELAAGFADDGIPLKDE